MKIKSTQEINNKSQIVQKREMIKIKDNIKKRLTVKLRQRFVIENESVKQKKAYEVNMIDYKKTVRNYI